mgnify:CR=1 FL=1
MTATERRAREECDDEANGGVSDTMMSGDGAMMMDGDEVVGGASDGDVSARGEGGGAISYESYPDGMAEGAGRPEGRARTRCDYEVDSRARDDEDDEPAAA